MRLLIRQNRLTRWIFFLWCAGGAMAATDLSVYDDAFLNGFRHQYWASLNATNLSPVHSGLRSISVQPGDYWQGIYFHHPGFDTTPYSSLSFWVEGSTNGGQRLQAQGLLNNSNPPTDVYHRFQISTTWQHITIPLATLGIDRKTNCNGFWIQVTPSGGSNGFYVDDVQFNADVTAATFVEPTNSVAVPAPAPQAEASWSLAAWCIAGALVFMTGLLGWLILMLRRSGLGTSTALVPLSQAMVPGGSLKPQGLSGAPGMEVLPDEHTRQLREKVALELAEFAKQSLIQGLYSQRGQLMETQQKAQEELAALEARLAMLQLPLQERIKAYESRIDELEEQLENRDQEMHDMIQATLLLVRERLEKEKAKEKISDRLN